MSGGGLGFVPSTGWIYKGLWKFSWWRLVPTNQSRRKTSVSGIMHYASWSMFCRWNGSSELIGDVVGFLPDSTTFCNINWIKSPVFC